jgi:hypothetical protein
LKTAPINPNLNTLAKAAPQFGGISPGAVVGIRNTFANIQSSRTKEMLVEDLVGFGFLRTGMDLFRQYFFNKTPDNQRQLNVSAARERMIREVGSIFTDNFSGGIIAYLLAAGANRFYKPNFANQFTSAETMELFNSLAQKSPNKQAFVRNLAELVAPNNKDILMNFRKVLEAPARRMIGTEQFQDAAVAISQKLVPGKQTLDVVTKKGTFALDILIEDASKFLGYVGKTAAQNKPWQQEAKTFLANTLRINSIRLPIGLGLAMAMTLGVPYLNHYITRKVDGIESYPGEKGLRAMKSAENRSRESWTEKLFPYLSKSTKAGNFWPLVATAVPLPFAFGLIDSMKLSSGSVASAFNPIGKGYLGRLAKMLQFGKGFPFTTQQQMASCFAFLIFSRLTTARSDIEFRERMVDSFLGWGIWILATPRIKKFIAKLWDERLLKTQGAGQVLKREVELQRLVCKVKGTEETTSHLLKKGLKSPLAKFIVMSAASLGITIALLGIIEPYIAIKWTEWQARKNKAKNPTDDLQQPWATQNLFAPQTAGQRSFQFQM